MSYELTDLPQSANVQAFWKFEEASGIIYDETTNDNDGSYNGALYQQTGKVDYGLGLDGDNDKVSVNDSASFDGIIASGKISISIWVKFNNLTGGRFVDKRDDGNNKRQWGFGYDATNVNFITNDDGTAGGWLGVSFPLSGNITTGVWYNIMGVNDGTNVKLYLNGIEKGTDTGNATIFDGNAPIGIGAYIGDGSENSSNLNATIDEAIIWDKDLTPTEVEDVYKLGNAECLEDTLTLSDEVKISLRPEREELSDTINLSDEIHVARLFYADDLEDTINLSDEIDVETSKNLKDTITLSDDLHLEVIERPDIDNDFRSCIEVLEDIDNKFNSVIEVRNDNMNVFNSVFGVRTDIGGYNDLRTELLVRHDILNDFRTLAKAPTTTPSVPTGFEGKDWETPASVAFQSKGKEYIKVYFDSVEQTNVDIDTITINKILDGAHTATFVLGKAYDSGKPDMESVVEIKYDDKLLYKGYIVQIMPTDEPDTIKINCQDKFWKQNKTRHDFSVGHPPREIGERTFYETIKEALFSKFGWAVDIGNFTPQNIDLNDTQESNAITQLINESGNYSWYYDENGNKKLWRAGEGSIINLQRQELNTNINLYHVLRHNLTDDVSNIINKYKVVMGDKVEKNIDYIANEGSIEHMAIQSQSIHEKVYPAWSNDDYTKYAKNTVSEFGMDNVKKVDEEIAKEAYTKYSFKSLRGVNEEWDDIYPPYIVISVPRGRFLGGYFITIKDYKKRGEVKGFKDEEILTEGFTIDYENETVTLDEQAYIILYKTSKKVDPSYMTKPTIKVHLWKVKRWEWEEEMSGEEEYESPLIFNTTKMCDYPETIMQTLSLSNLTVQEGGQYTKPGYWGRDDDGDLVYFPEELVVIPSWNDTEFAKDYANYLLSQTCNKKTTGNINLTLDTICHYHIDLSKRINITGVTEEALNIDSMNFNIGSWLVTLNLKNGREYKRQTSIPYRGE